MSVYDVRFDSGTDCSVAYRPDEYHTPQIPSNAPYYRAYDVEEKKEEEEEE